jgi:hypothetical protein
MQDIIERIMMYGEIARDPNMDGYTQFNAKQKLYKILWEVEKQITRAPNFLDEDKWILSRKDK